MSFVFAITAIVLAILSLGLAFHAGREMGKTEHLGARLFARHLAEKLSDDLTVTSIALQVGALAAFYLAVTW